MTMKSADNKTVFITGGGGYVGKLLVSVLTKKDWVEHLVVIDKQPQPDFFSDIADNVTYLQKNTLDDWQSHVAEFAPEVVIHAAWEIREPYFDKSKYQKENIAGTRKVFNFAFNASSVQKLIHFSTVASYGASKDNSIDDRFEESDELSECGYSYADQKLAVEKILRSKHKKANQAPQVAVVRPASITGPFGRNAEAGFGLQSALMGDLEDSDSFWHRLIDKLLFFTPVTPQWVRQFVHEDDVINIVTLLAGTNLQRDFEVFNLAPPGDVLRGQDMAAVVGKPAFTILPQLVRLAFFLVWHLSLGKIPTAPGVWKTYSYPIAVDGSKVTSQLGYEYQFNAREAVSSEAGKFLPTVDR